VTSELPVVDPPEPRLVAFMCRWCASAAADQAGRARLPLPHSLLTVELPCTGRVEPAFVLQAFREGADGVLVAGCHPGDCHYVDGNLRAHARHALLSRALQQAGLEPERLQLVWAGASEAERLVAAATRMTEALRRLGPLDLPRRALAASAPAELEQAPRDPPPRAPGKPRVAFYWNASCGGCEEAVVDLGEGFADLAERVEIVLWPVAMDWKRADVEAMPDGHIDVAFLNGALRLDEQEDWARLLRRKARRVVAFGACAHLGGVVGLGNLSTPDQILDAAYRDAPTISNPEGPVPGRPGGHHALEDGALTPHLPILLPRTLPLAGAVEVDAVIPGCPPSTAVITAALEVLLGGAALAPGVVLAPNASLCDTCPRRDSKPERLELTALRRLDTTQPDEATCFLAQGLVCLGPGTRQGCQPGCLEVNMPCRGCFGALDGVADAGAAALSAMASLLHGDEAAIARLAAGLPDPAGLFWRYGYAAGLVPLRLPGGRP